MMRYLAALSFSVAALACGPAPEAEAPAPTNMAFKDMNLQQKTAFMKQIVMPRTRQLFADFDPKFSDMGCRTCHGDSVDDGSFSMPNPKIRPLPGTEEAFMAQVGKEPEMGKWAGFMAQKLEPAMGEMLKATIFDPKTGQGEFGCKNCHTIEK